MKKLLPCLGLALAMAFTLTGCELYFGDHHDDYDDGDSWSYCAADGYYVCSGNECSWAGPQCPDGGGGGGGTECSDDTQCAAGCYCQNGGCEEGGFCGDDQDCPTGYHCDDRSSCVPDTCTGPDQCMAGQTCDNGNCNTTCVCENDADAQAAGYGYCDETRHTCMVGQDPAGSCNGDVTCTTAPPRCTQGQVPLIADGCYTGECRAIASCDTAPSCAALGYEADCLSRPNDCGAVYTGRNCHKPNGAACQAGDTDCTCAIYEFNSCEDQGMPKSFVDSTSGARFPMSH